MIKKKDNNIDTNYISNIGDIYGNVKDVTLRAKLITIRVFEFADTIMCILNLDDGTGKISAFLINDKDDSFKNLVKSLTVDNTYLARGNITDIVLLHISDIDKDYINDFKKETNANLEDYLISGKVFLIKAIKESGGE